MHKGAEELKVTEAEEVTVKLCPISFISCTEGGNTLHTVFTTSDTNYRKIPAPGSTLQPRRKQKLKRILTARVHEVYGEVRREEESN